MLEEGVAAPWLAAQLAGVLIHLVVGLVSGQAHAWVSGFITGQDESEGITLMVLFPSAFLSLRSIFKYF